MVSTTSSLVVTDKLIVPARSILNALSLVGTFETRTPYRMKHIDPVVILEKALPMVDILHPTN